MSEPIIRLSILLLVSALACGIVWTGKRYVEVQRQRALATIAPEVISLIDKREEITRSSAVRILAFSSADCHQCHTLQAPALRRVLSARGSDVTVVDIDAPSTPELVESYRVLTVPTTVILDERGHAHAINYGFANTQKLLQQVDAVLAELQVAS